jgi:hypothetical protein
MQILLLSVHLLWVLWMIAGTLLAMLGFRYSRLWTWRYFRILHLAAILATATVPLWNRGVCPITAWEAALTTDSAPAPFLARVLAWLVYWDIPLWVLSSATAAAAIVTLVVFIMHPPWTRSRGK